MRFTFDYFVSLYVADLVAKRKHDEQSLHGKYYYVPARYTADFPPLIDNIQCNMSQIVVLQTGAWDIDVFGAIT